MFSMTEQFTQAQAQNRASLEAQLSMFNSLAVTALDAVGQLVALNLALVKAPFGASSGTLAQLRVVPAPHEAVALIARTLPDADAVQGQVQVRDQDFPKVSRSVQHEFFETTPSPAKPTMPAGSGQAVSIATATAKPVADVPAKPRALALAVAEAVPPRTPASAARKLATVSAAPEPVPAKSTPIAVTAAAPATTVKTTPASKVIHAKQGDASPAGKTTAATQAPKLQARSSQPRLQGRKIPGKK